MRELSLLIFLLMLGLLFVENRADAIKTNNIIETEIKLVSLQGDCREAGFDQWNYFRTEKDRAIIIIENSEIVLKRVSDQNIFEVTHGDLHDTLKQIPEENEMAFFRYMSLEINLEKNTFSYIDYSSLNINRPTWCDGRIERYNMSYVF